MTKDKVKYCCKKTKEAIKKADIYIKENPYKSVAVASSIATLAGVVVGYLIGGKRRD